MRGPMITHPGPSTGPVSYCVGRAWFTFFGWQTEGEPPAVKRAVIIAAPHTSNWDLPHMLAAAFLFRMRISWLGKHTLFSSPLGPLLRWLGGLAVDRRAPGGLVAQAAARLRDSESLLLAVPPSGTRSRGDSWKSGFYWIALTAGVPIVCSYLDYGRKRACIGLTLQPTGDVHRDMDQIREFYVGVRGLYPENQTPVRLRDEERASSEHPDGSGPAEHEARAQRPTGEVPRDVDRDGA
ncbi:MAG: 1-acyl-sn-glycerol-3-phosphate acyltransferase [Myxococcota bacterium]|jgi:1-acyl-sn-glycerol-3-phosphate acyltransferase